MNVQYSISYALITALNVTYSFAIIVIYSLENESIMNKWENTHTII